MVKARAIAWAKPRANAEACAKTPVGVHTPTCVGPVCCYSNSPGEMPRCDVIVTSFYLGFCPGFFPGYCLGFCPGYCLGF